MNRSLKEEYRQYTLGLALFDIVPVLVFLAAGVLLWTMWSDKLLLAGVICSFIAGLSKVLWKLEVVVKKRNSAVLTGIFHFLMPVGFILMILAVALSTFKCVAGGGAFADSAMAGLWRGLTMRPAMWCFLGGFAGMCLMGYLGSHMDESAKANWIEALVNAAAQLAMLAGVVFVYMGMIR
jgi:hypothetical protein